MRIQEDVQMATMRDPVNITVYGNPVLDVIIRVGPYATNATAVRAINKIGRIRPEGAIEFQPDSYIVCFLQRDAAIFGPLNPNGQMDFVLPGGKYPVPFSIGGHANNLEEKVYTQLAGPELRLGGGGANVLSGFFDIYAQLKVQFIATVETSESEGRLEPFIRALTDVVGVFDPVQVYEYPGVNLCIEGLGISNERTIFTAQLPEEKQIADLPRPRGKSIMVNTVYSPTVALDALAYASYPDRLGVLALTKSLCAKKPIPQRVLQIMRRRHPEIFTENTHIESVYGFVKNVVLPRGHCICVMNEDELEHFTGIDFFIKKDRTRVPVLAGLIRAIKKFREFQAGLRHRIYVTAGHWGSFVLNEDDHLIYCGIYRDPTRIPHGKTAIGDTYATFILALETIGNYIRPYVISAEDVIRTASAGADASVYEGFGLLSVAKVNRYVGERSRLVANLGPIESLQLEKWEIGLDEIRESDYQGLARADHKDGPGTLQEVIGRAFLRA